MQNIRYVIPKVGITHRLRTTALQKKDLLAIHLQLRFKDLLRAGVGVTLVIEMYWYRDGQMENLVSDRSCTHQTMPGV